MEIEIKALKVGAQYIAKNYSLNRCSKYSSISHTKTIAYDARVDCGQNRYVQYQYRILCKYIMEIWFQGRIRRLSLMNVKSDMWLLFKYL